MATQTVQSMISPVSLCNQALSWVGANQITDFGDPGREAEWCRNNFAVMRDAVLEERMWTFARVRYVSSSADQSEWGSMYLHRKPSDWLKVFRVYDHADANPFEDDQCEWTVEGEYVLQASQTVYMWGSKRITDTGMMTTMFTQALTARLASFMAIPLSGNRQLQVDYWNLYQAALTEAATRDGQQGSNNRIQSGALINARMRG